MHGHPRPGLRLAVGASGGRGPAGSGGRLDAERRQEEGPVGVDAGRVFVLEVQLDLDVEEAALPGDTQVEGLVEPAFEHGELRVEPAGDFEREPGWEQGARQILGVLAGGVAEGDVGASHPGGA